MHFLKSLLLIALTVAVVLFAIHNFEPVTILLWGGLEVDIKLPFLLLLVFLAGFVPMFLLHRARLWSLRRRLESMERQMSATRIAPAPAPEPLSDVEAPRSERVVHENKLWPSS